MFDCWPPRNAAATELRGFVTQDGTPPAEMRRIAYDQLRAYDAFALRDDARVEAIKIEGEGATRRFVIEAGTEPVAVRRVLLCVGVVDVLPDIPGYRTLWGTGVFQCPYCHGWEVRDKTFGYLAPDQHCANWSLILRAWTSDLVVFTDGKFEVPAPMREELAVARVRIEEQPVVGLRHDGDKLAAVQLADGREIEREILFARPPQQQTALVKQLGLALAAHDLVEVDEHHQTSAPGIYAAGDLTCRDHGALTAAANGSAAAHALDEDLTRELLFEGAI